MRIELLSPENTSAIREYLEHEPYANVFLLDHIGLEPVLRPRGRTFVAIDDTIRPPENSVRGVVFFGRQTVIAAQLDAIPAIAQLAFRFPSRMIVGPRSEVQQLWEVIASKYPAPRIVRDRQHLMALVPENIRMHDGAGVETRLAHVDEWREVAENSALMIQGELGYDPRTAGDFGIGVREMIECETWWVGTHVGAGGYSRLCFFCHTGPESARTVQLQGIWTPLQFRKRGWSTTAFGEICAKLLERHPTLSLYVNDFNHEAIRLYERIGFQTVGEFQTLLF